MNEETARAHSEGDVIKLGHHLSGDKVIYLLCKGVNRDHSSSGHWVVIDGEESQMNETWGRNYFEK